MHGFSRFLRVIAVLLLLGTGISSRAQGLPPPPLTALFCPANITVNNDPGQCGALVSYPPPTAQGPVGTITCVPASGSFFPVGTTTVQCTAASGAKCSFTVTVFDTQAPTWTCPADILTNTDPGQCGALVAFQTPTATDNCTTPPRVECNNPITSPHFFPVGNTPFECIATDAAGNAAVCSFTVRVRDAEPPKLTCPANLTANAEAGQCGASVAFPTPTATDNCTAAPTVVCLVDNRPVTSPHTFPVGTTTVFCLAFDAAGNTSTCSFTVTVRDQQAPDLSCPANLTANAAAGQCSALVAFPTPTATDGCTATPSVVCRIGNQVITSPHTFPVGTTTVTCTATDEAGNSSTCSFTVTVNDTEVPTISCPGNITVDAVSGQCGALVTFPSPAASDRCSTPTVVCRIGDQVITSPHTFPIGTTTVTCTATDAAGNSNSCSFMVTVTDTTKPTLTCPGNITVASGPGQCIAAVTFAAPTATDECGTANVVCQIGGQTITSPHTFPIGTTTVTCTATDGAGNSETCTFTVTVTDTEPPTLTCPPSVLLPQDAGQRFATFAPTPAVAQDNCPGLLVTGSRSDGLPLSDPTYPVGGTVLTWTATDASGNSSSCTQVVVVHDSQIVGVVGLDANGNHVPDLPQEPRLKGVTIELRDPVQDAFWLAHPETKQPEPLAVTQTDEVGNFRFSVAPPGVYDVVVRLLPGQTISALFPGPFAPQVQTVTVNGEPRLRVTMQRGDTVAGMGILVQVSNGQ